MSGSPSRTDITDTGPPACGEGADDAEAVDDAEVVAQSLEQPELFARLYDRYAPDIHRYVAGRLGDGMADDSPTLEYARAGPPSADTFLTAFRIRARYDRARTNARPWLYGIAGNLGRATELLLGAPLFRVEV